jgi:hypothetical protein
MSSNPPASDSNQNRLYTRFINILKIIQFIGYFIVVLYSLFPARLLSFAVPAWAVFVVFLILPLMGCIIVYIITQGLIAIIDLLSRIERNTRT